ncbi:MAG TPA: hypothetical protein VE621_07455 [Bryobacteraceae bacterium]|nr:hypothetical protein [Bryobacteraceae bacterium]
MHFAKLPYHLCLLAITCPLFGQKLSIGVIGGGSLTHAFKERFTPEPVVPGYTSPFASTGFFSESRDYLVGAMLEYHLNPRWSVEVDGLFRQLHMTTAARLRDGTLVSASPTPVVTWEFPVLAKYRMQLAGFKTFVEAGPSFRTTGNLNASDPSQTGVAAGAGIELAWRGIGFAPGLRYTRWAKDRGLPNTAISAPNQVEWLVRVTRRPQSDWKPLGSRISVGGVAGVNLTGYFGKFTQQYDGVFGSVLQKSEFSSGPRRLVAGAMLELYLSRRWSLEIDALHQPTPFSIVTTYTTGQRLRFTSDSVTWEFPVLSKFRLPTRAMDIFVSGGPSFRLKQQALVSSSAYGATFGLGVNRQIGPLRVSPGLRYTRWGADDYPGGLRTKQDQVQVLVGFSAGGQR